MEYEDELEFDRIADEYEIESWEAEYAIYENNDWTGLLNLRKRELEKRPTNLNAQHSYAEALILNKKYEEALEYMTPLYNENFDRPFGEVPILDALYGLGKTINDFKWKIRPDIHELNYKLLKTCKNMLKSKRNYREIISLFNELQSNGYYCVFGQIEFAKYLIKHEDIFSVEIDQNNLEFSKIKLTKKW